VAALEEKKNQIKKNKNLADKTVDIERSTTRIVDLEVMLRLKTTAIDAEEQVHLNAVAGEKKKFKELPYVLK
jgi:hypothetical protein